MEILRCNHTTVNAIEKLREKKHNTMDSVKRRAFTPTSAPKHITKYCLFVIMMMGLFGGLDFGLKTVAFYSQCGMRLMINVAMNMSTCSHLLAYL